MEMTHNRAMEALKAGDEILAWEIASKDEGLNPGVTKEQWLAHGQKCLVARAEQARANAAMFSLAD